MILSVKRNSAKIHSKFYEVAVGEGGYSFDKREGDGTTPIGTYPLKEVYYRADRIKNKLKTSFKMKKIRKNDGWCDDINSEHYNKFVKLPFEGSHEKLWREDDIYNLILVIGYNDSPAIPGKGSAIFIHVAEADYSPTKGCIAFKQKDLIHVLEFLGQDSQIEILG